MSWIRLVRFAVQGLGARIYLTLMREFDREAHLQLDARRRRIRVVSTINHGSPKGSYPDVIVESDGTSYAPGASLCRAQQRLALSGIDASSERPLGLRGFVRLRCTNGVARLIAGNSATSV